MKLIIRLVLGFTLFTPLPSFAEGDLHQSAFNQLKQNIAKSCQNQEFLNCVNISNDTCQTVSGDQLEQISTLMQSNAKILVQGEFTEFLKQIKTVRNNVLKANNIEVAKANACGKEFLTG